MTSSHCGERNDEAISSLKQTVSIFYRIRHRLLFFSFMLVTIALLTSCAIEKEISRSGQIHIISNVPFYPQETYQCGPAALASVLNFWGIRVEPEEISKEIFSESARGTLNIDMVLYGQRKGLEAIQYAANMGNLKRNIDSGHPVIVLVDYGFSLYQVNHFMVIIGYYEDGVIADSGRQQNKFIAEKDFLKIWARTNYWTLLIKRSVEHGTESKE